MVKRTCILKEYKYLKTSDNKRLTILIAFEKNRTGKKRRIKREC